MGGNAIKIVSEAIRVKLFILLYKITKHNIINTKYISELKLINTIYWIEFVFIKRKFNHFKMFIFALAHCFLDCT